jgi:dienelactone hydrolase
MAHPLEGFEAGTFSAEGNERTVYRSGSGPAVVVISEMPGITPRVADFGRKVAAAGLTAVMPHLFGEDGRAPSAGYMASSITRACISREFAVLATDRTSPVIGWLRALAREEHERCGGPGVGAVGMCFTGGFALGMMVDERLRAPVLSQPSLPFPVGRRRKAATGVSDNDLARVQARVGDGACVLGLRFTQDGAVPAARFETLREALGDGFIAVEIDSSKGNPHGIRRRAHSVLTLDLVDEPGHPTQDALERVLRFFDERLR